jgi:hypothetical protein
MGKSYKRWKRRQTSDATDTSTGDGKGTEAAEDASQKPDASQKFIKWSKSKKNTTKKN